MLNLLATATSLGFYYFCLLILSSETFSKNFQPELTGVALDILTNFKGLLVIFLTPLMALLPDLIFAQFGYNMYPSPPQLLKKFINSAEVKKVLLADASDMRKKNVSMPDKGEAQTIFGGKKTLNLNTQGYNTIAENSKDSRQPIKEGGRDQLGLLKKEEMMHSEFDTKNPLKTENDKDSESPFQMRKKSNRKEVNVNDNMSGVGKKKGPVFKSQTVIEIMNNDTGSKEQIGEDPHEINAQEDKDLVNIFQKNKV
jgi:hypothetical protein